uniref:Integrase core domain containing protein n=1 Tax=Solanum tuberosum TaxID=4113 RepID=M1DUR4_SOLTU
MLLQAQLQAALAACLAKLARLRFDVDALLAPAETVLEAEPMDEANDMMMTALFGDTMPPPDPTPAAGNCHRFSDHNFNTEEARRPIKKELQKLEASQRQSIIDEELR